MFHDEDDVPAQLWSFYSDCCAQGFTDEQAFHLTVHFFLETLRFGLESQDADSSSLDENDYEE